MGNKLKTISFINNIILQFVTFYSYDDLKIVLFTSDENEYYFEKLIVCDINDIATEDNSLNAIYFFLKDALCVIETINQGIIGEDVLLDSTCFINVKDKKELKQNKVYYRQGQVKYSDKRSE